MLNRIKELYEYKDMVLGLVKRDLRGRYKGSLLGFFWNFINPLCQIIVYIIVFTHVFNNNIECYYIYLITGMMPWLFFSESLSQGAGCIVHQAEMTKKIYFPREILTIANVTSRFINMLLTFIIIFILIFFSGRGVNAVALTFLPLIMIIEYIMVLGFSLILSAISVYFRDVEHITGVVMMALIWLTPIMYTIDMFKGKIKFLILCNPMTYITEMYHSVLYYKSVPDIVMLAVTAMFSLILLVVGELIFRKLEVNFAEEL